MEFLVTMTTHVPEGTSEETLNDVRAREAAHTRELAAAGHVLRLWRPPLAPGEWRTLGLFAAPDAAELAKILASMPLHVWRIDEVTPLSPHGNDAETPREAAENMKEYLSTFTVTIPDGTPKQAVDDAMAAETRRARELAAQGHLIRLWAMPLKGDAGRALGLWAARDDAQMRQMMDELPMASILTTEITPLTRHPSDPGHSRPVRA